jgi:hypothetical protein
MEFRGHNTNGLHPCGETEKSGTGCDERRLGPLRSGTLWEGRFRSCLTDGEGYLLACSRYMPIAAGA